MNHISRKAVKQATLNENQLKMKYKQWWQTEDMHTELNMKYPMYPLPHQLATGIMKYFFLALNLLFF